MRYLHRICAALLVLAGICPKTLLGQGPVSVQITVDHAAYAYSESESLVEFYLAVEAASLDFERDGDFFVARLPLDMALHHKATPDVVRTPAEAAWTDSLVLRFALADTSGIFPGQHFMHKMQAVVSPGRYQLRVSMAEDQSRRRIGSELRRDVAVPHLGSGSLPALSDVTLATSIAPSEDREDVFFKNGLIVRPNATQLFGQRLNRLFYYAEAYGTDVVAGSDGAYMLHTYVAEAIRPQPVADLDYRQRRPARAADAIAGEFDVSRLPTGSYLLRIVVLNESSEPVIEGSRKFFVYNPDVARTQPAADEADVPVGDYAAMTEKEVEQRLSYAAIIANETERRRISRLEDLDAKREFLASFWQKRDDKPGTAVNEYKEEVYRRIRYANERYASNTLEGWRSDRGRVLVKYGVPSEIEPHLYDRDSVPYEIWQYNDIPGEGQALFVFADVTGFGRFELLHSTVTGERSVPNWRDELSLR